MSYEEIEHHLKEQLKKLDVDSGNPNRIVSFAEYKAVYDTLLALKQAQAMERQARATERIVDLLQGFDDYGFRVKNI